MQRIPLHPAFWHIARKEFKELKDISIAQLRSILLI